MSVHYKFKSALDYDTVTFDGLHISVGDLKKSIIQQKRIGRNTDFDLQVTNAQTKEVYNDESALIPKNTSLIIARVPLAVQQNKSRPGWNDANAVPFGGARVSDDPSVQGLSKAVDLARLDASEDDKIRAMMTQSTLDYDPSNYMKIRGANQMGEVPANYRCFKCHQPGHWIKNCPLGLSQEPVEIKKSTGIPRSFMVPVEGPMVPGAMMTPTGQYAVPALDHQAYNSDGAGRGNVEIEQRPDIPEDLLCTICKDLLTDAVMIPCCGNSFCDECIRTILLDSEDHECPDCHDKGISPGTLIPNRFLRNSVLTFRNETGYRKRHQYRQAITKSAPTVPTVESTSEESTKPPVIKLADFVPPNDELLVAQSPNNQQDQKPVISEADSTEHSVKQVATTPANDETKPVNNDVSSKNSTSQKPATKGDDEIEKPTVKPEVSQGQAITSVASGVQSKAVISQPVYGMRSIVPPGTVTQPPNSVYVPQGEERPGTPTVDEPGIGVQPTLPHSIPAFPPGETPPFMSPPDLAANTNAISTIRPMPPTTYPQQYPPGTAGMPGSNITPVYQPPYQSGGVRPVAPDYNPRPFLPPRMPYDQTRPPQPRPYDPARPPPSVFQGYPPRANVPIAPRPPYGVAPLRNNAPGMRPILTTGVIDDPLAAFERMLREKDERDRLNREARRSRSRSYSPRSRRTRSSSRSRSYSPRSRTRSPMPKPKLRNRSRTVSRSRSRSRGQPVRRSRTPRSRERSFSLSRSYSRSLSPREYSPRRGPIARGRYRSPPSRNSPPRYRYSERRGVDRDRSYNQPNRDREYSNYYDNHPSSSEYIEADRERPSRRGEDREKIRDYDTRDRRSRGTASSRPGVRYIPSPTMRKEYPLQMLPPTQSSYYPSSQEHSSYHHQAPIPNRYPGSQPPGRVASGNSYPPSLMSVKTGMPPLDSRHYDPPAPPGTEEPTVPGFESPRLVKYDRNATSSHPSVDAPPGVDPQSSDTVLTKPQPDVDRPPKESRPRDREPPEPREKRDVHRRDYRSNDYVRNERDSRRGDKKAPSPTEWKHTSKENRSSPSRDRHSKSPEKHHHRHRHESPPSREKRVDPDRDKLDKRRESSDDEKSKIKNKEKKKKKKEKEAEKNKKKEEKKKRKEQEKLKKAEEKKIKSEKEKDTVKVNNKEKSEEKVAEAKIETEILENSTKQTDDLYSDILTDGIDTKVVENYGKIHEETEDIKEDRSPENIAEMEKILEKDVPFDGIDLHVSENDVIKSEPHEVKSRENKEILAPFPVPSKWEVDEEAAVNEKKETHPDEKIDGTSKDIFEKNSNKVVTSEVLKHAENAIFKKAINAIRPIEIKKISLDRAKLYSGEKNSEAGSNHSPNLRRSLEKETITPSNIQVTIPMNDWGETRFVDINPSSTNVEVRRSSEQPRDISSAIQKPVAPRLSVRERLGSKVDELDKIVKEDRPYSRNRSKSLSPISRRKKDEIRKNTDVEDRKRKYESTSAAWRGRNNLDKKRRSRSKDRHREPNRRGETRSVVSSSRRDDSRRDETRRDDTRRDRHNNDRYNSREKIAPKRTEQKRIDYKDDKHREKKVVKRSRSKSKDSVRDDKNKNKKKDKKHKKEKVKKHKSEDEQKESSKPTKPEKETVEEKPVEKKITERRKPTLDEANFEPDYDALDTESDTDEKKTDTVRKRERSKSPGGEVISKKRKSDEEITKKSVKSKEPSSSSNSSSESSSSEEEKSKKKHKKHKKHKSSKKASSSSSSESESGSSSEEEKRKRNKSKKHKSSKRSMKKKKKSKHK